MFLSEIFAGGFRCFGADNPLALSLHRGLNILVGPNDAGKTAIIDAPRYVLWTRGDDYVRLDGKDFHVDDTGIRASELLIRCTFDDLTPDEESRFLEWCTNESTGLRLHVCLRASLRKLAGGGATVLTQHRAGKDAEGLPIEGDLREYLKSTYLRPLRDAERELRSGRRSRLSRILGAMPTMALQAGETVQGQPQTLVDTMRETDALIDQNLGVKNVQDAVNTSFLDKLSFERDPLAATLGLGVKGSFDQILERLELYLNPPNGQPERIARGLGYNNLLYMAAELLLLESHPDQVPLLLVEEPEAHLHPQHQTLFMQVLEKRASPSVTAEGKQQVQVLLTTHSPQLAAGADIENLTMVVGHRTYSLASKQTKLEQGDYEFLRRFLDATKANLFFARGLIVVEGDAENLLLPAIAAKLGRPLGKYGVSLVNVGHRGLFRYSRILQRADGTKMPIPVALIPDRDIPPDVAKALVGDQETEGEYSVEKKEKHLGTLMAEKGGCVEVFPSEQWTLEFDLARQHDLATLLHQAVELARRAANGTAAKLNADKVKADASAQVAAWQADAAKSIDDVALEIYTPLKKRSVSKAQVAEQLAKLIGDLPDDAATFRAKVPLYLVNAVEYVTDKLPHVAENDAGHQGTPGAGAPDPGGVAA
jgi:putative ATP-dependent endonuclease of OLD family